MKLILSFSDFINDNSKQVVLNNIDKKLYNTFGKWKQMMEEDGKTNYLKQLKSRHQLKD